jgi:ActR/RegA family two-component response regulator
MIMNVLIIGNNYQSAIYSGLLTGYGYRIAEARTAGDGYSLLASGLKPSTVILDLKFGDLRDIIPALRAIGGDQIRIVVIGGDNAAGSPAVQRSANVFLHKPVAAEDVLHAVQPVVS